MFRQKLALIAAEESPLRSLFSERGLQVALVLPPADSEALIEELRRSDIRRGDIILVDCDVALSEEFCKAFAFSLTSAEGVYLHYPTVGEEELKLRRFAKKAAADPNKHVQYDSAGVYRISETGELELRERVSVPVLPSDAENTDALRQRIYRRTAEYYLATFGPMVGVSVLA